MRTRIASIAVAVAIALVTTFAAAPARAVSTLADAFQSIWYMGAATTANVGGMVTLVGQSVYIGLDERPNLGWRVSGGVFGAAQMFSGVALAAQCDRDWCLGYGLATVFAGVANLGLVVAGHAMPEPGAASIHVAPLLLPDAGDGWAGGVGVTVVGF